jgi:hypothetical protein
MICFTRQCGCVQADVGIGGSVQEVDRSGVVRVPHDRMQPVSAVHWFA